MEFIQDHTAAICFVIGGLLSLVLVCMYVAGRAYDLGAANGHKTGSREGYERGRDDAWKEAHETMMLKPAHGARGKFVKHDNL